MGEGVPVHQLGFAEYLRKTIRCEACAGSGKTSKGNFLGLRGVFEEARCVVCNGRGRVPQD